MSGRQRLVNLAIAAVIAVIAVVVIVVTSGDDDEPARTPVATATGTAQPEFEPREESTPKPEPTPAEIPLVRFEGGEVVGGVQEITVSEGDRVRFDVSSDVPDHVHVHAYDLMIDVQPGQVAHVAFEATITGVIEVELEDAGVEIVELRVTP